MPQAFHLVDAFTAEAFTGNPAAVYVFDQWRDDAWLQRVAREMNQSETAFLVRTGGAYQLRWFTPLIEVELCGHATLASAHVLWSAALAKRGEPIHFTTKSGPLVARQTGDRIELDFPLLTEEPTAEPPGLADALGVAPIYVGKSRHDVVVEVASENEVRGARPNFTRLATVATRGVIVTAKS